ncbi:hypothetical protein IF125_04240 [Empedobacter stercoris]|uniref:hypothetical protein n=1 Tax=Empedobacter stercoris TaxID=1628248 RepID=UPI001CE11BD1|nr:hypothetical protein [Empedobacter stercoris]MCA4781472.1 hypothetical protein [Empedobacter stercoris]
MTTEQIEQAWGEELYNAFSEWIDDKGWLVGNWPDYLEENYSNWDKNYNDTNIKSNLYSQMYNLDIEFLDENEDACRPVELREVEFYTTLSEKLNKSYKVTKSLSLIDFNDEDVVKIINAANNFNPKDYSEKDTVLPTEESLLKLKIITHPDWQYFFNDEKIWKDVVKDIQDGITFFFYWKDNFICWER